MDLTNYPHKPYNFRKLMNKEQFPQTTLAWTDYEEFNEIYDWCLKNLMKGEKTPSGGIKGGCKNRYHSFYFTNATRTSIELIIADTCFGCYKFVVKDGKSTENCVSGQKAVRTIYKLAKDFNCSEELKKHAVDAVKGAEIKEQIEPPHVELTSAKYRGREFDHCYHADANSSYFSRICEFDPALKPLGNYLMEHRKENDGFYKHVMTNAIGCWQSKFCIDVNDPSRKVPYQFAELAKAAINGNNRFVEDLCLKLIMNGFEPLLYNTDGLWYRDSTGKNRCYHDSNEGTGLGQWKNDHKDVKLYIKSPGAYQYIEDGAVKTVLRGYTNLDKEKPDRDTWSWREIDNINTLKFKFDEDKGITKDET